MEKKPQSTPQQPLSELLKKYQPRPGKQFYRRMAGAPWTHKEPIMPTRSNRAIQSAWRIAAVLLLILGVLAARIPSARASISAWLGLKQAPANQIVSTPILTLVEGFKPTLTLTPKAVARPTSAPTITAPQPTPTTRADTRPEEVKQLSTQAGWEILAASRLPKEYAFNSAYYDPKNQMVYLSYFATKLLPGATDPSQTETKTVTLVEALHNDIIPLEVAPGANPQDEQVGGQPAAYVVGAWDSEFVKDDQDPNGGKMVSTWKNELQVQNLFWQVGEVYLALITDDTGVSRQELVDMASSVGR